MRSAAPAVADDDVLAVLVQLSELAPAVLPACIEGAVTDQHRAAVVVDALATLGATEQAGAVRAYADERFGPPEPALSDLGAITGAR